MPEQAKAAPAALAAVEGVVTAEQRAKGFKRARRDRVEMLLSTPVSLGQTRQVSEGRYAAWARLTQLGILPAIGMASILADTLIAVVRPRVSSRGPSRWKQHRGLPLRPGGRQVAAPSGRCVNLSSQSK